MREVGRNPAFQPGPARSVGWSNDHTLVRAQQGGEGDRHATAKAVAIDDRFAGMVIKEQVDAQSG